MGRDSLTQYLKERGVVPSVPSEKTMRAQRKPAPVLDVPPVPSVPLHLNGTGKSMPIEPFGEAVNDPASPMPETLENLHKPAMPLAVNGPAAEPPIDPNVWRVLSTAYHAHHVKCPICIAAGRGDQYGLRCGAGAALWTSYQNT